MTQNQSTMTPNTKDSCWSSWKFLKLVNLEVCKLLSIIILSWTKFWCIFSDHLPFMPKSLTISTHISIKMLFVDSCFKILESMLRSLRTNASNLWKLKFLSMKKIGKMSFWFTKMSKAAVADILNKIPILDQTVKLTITKTKIVWSLTPKIRIQSII